jgi:hypothetical protein
VQARHRNPKTPELWLAAIRTEQRAGNTKAAEALLAKGMQVCQAGSFQINTPTTKWSAFCEATAV